MNGLDEVPMPPQTFLYGCVLESGKDVLFNPDDDGFDHQLDLRMACTDPATKDELHLVEVEGKDTEGQKAAAVLVSLKPSTLPSVCLGGFTISPPAIFRLKSGSGPIHISGQHLVMMESDQSFEDDDDDDDDDDDEEEEEEEEEEDVKVSKKRPALSPASKSQSVQKKMKLDAVDEDDDDDDDDDDDEEEEKTPVKAKPTPKSTQNGKSLKASTPATKQVKTPKQKEKSPKSPKTPTTPKETLTLPEIQAKMTEVVKKGVTLPKAQPKFENFVKNSYRISDAKVIAELWKWRQTVADPK
ncbi:nucleophosmin 1a [Vanacampus margaritifer]